MPPKNPPIWATQAIFDPSGAPINPIKAEMAIHAMMTGIILAFIPVVPLRIARMMAPNSPLIPPDAPKHIVDLVRKHAPQYKLSPTLVLAFIKVESNYDTIALSPKNAKGLMQLIPETATRFGVARPYDAEQNIRGGMAYLSWLMAYFEGNVPLVAAAYNAGEGAVNRYRGVPPYAETRAYVARILANFGRVNHPFDAGLTGPSPQLPLMRAMFR